MATAATATGIRIARPSIYIDGQNDIALGQALLQLIISEDVQGLYHCEARFGNWGPKGNSIGFMYFDRKKLDFGKPMQIKIDQDKIFDGRISAIEANFGEARPPEIAVLLEDRFQDLRMTQRTRTFADVSDSDVMNRIASDYGLQPNIDVSGPSYKVLAQVNQSDLSFLRERARAIDAEIWLDDKTLHCQSRTKRNNGTVKVNYGGELREVTVTADLAGQRTSVKVNGWDISGKSAMTYEANDQVISGELGSDSSGISILKSAFGDRKEALAHTVPLSSREAQTEAEAVMRMTARRFVIAHGITQADAKLRVGTYIDMQGLGPLFSGKYYLCHVKHVFEGTQGFVTEFSAERSGIGKP
jgi:hypothetical protein